MLFAVPMRTRATCSQLAGRRSLRLAISMGERRSGARAAFRVNFRRMRHNSSRHVPSLRSEIALELAQIGGVIFVFPGAYSSIFQVTWAQRYCRDQHPKLDGRPCTAKDLDMFHRVRQARAANWECSHDASEP
jgi:hypothetical protein